MSTFLAAVMLAGIQAAAQDNRPWLAPRFDGVPLDADLADTIVGTEKDDLLVWGQCETWMGDPLPECLLLAVERDAGFEIIALHSKTCTGGGVECYGGYARFADVTVGEDDREAMEALLDVEGGLGGTPLGMVEGTGCGTMPELRVRVHGGIATSPMGVTGGPLGEDLAGIPELRVKVYGGIASSPLGVEAPDVDQCVTVESGLGSCPLGILDYPTETLVAELMSMIVAVIK